MQTSLPGVQQLHFDLGEQLSEGRFEGYLVFDIDGFHQLNARQGYKMGDRVLGLVERFFVDGGVKVYRIGGDQFGVIGCGSKVVGREIQAGLKVLGQRQLDLNLTISGGGGCALDDSLAGMRRR